MAESTQAEAKRLSVQLTERDAELLVLFLKRSPFGAFMAATDGYDPTVAQSGNEEQAYELQGAAMRLRAEIEGEAGE